MTTSSLQNEPVTAEPSATDTHPRDRHLAIPGLYNLRDTGGYRTANGETKWGKLFRSDALHRLDAAALQSMLDSKIRHIIDLRSDHELAQSPSRMIDAAVTTHHLPVFAGATPEAQAFQGITLGSLYEHIVDARSKRLVEAIRTIAQTNDDEAVLVHCTAGKDRTGLVIGLSLAAVGVDYDDVVTDYAASERYLAGEWAEAMLDRVRGSVPEEQLNQDIIDIVSASPASVMADVLERIDQKYGSPSDYLLSNGLTRDELDRLTAVLVA